MKKTAVTQTVRNTIMSPFIKQRIYENSCQENNLNTMMCIRMALSAYRLTTEELNEQFRRDRKTLTQIVNTPLTEVFDAIGAYWIEIIEARGFSVRFEDGYMNLYKLAV